MPIGFASRTKLFTVAAVTVVSSVACDAAPTKRAAPPPAVDVDVAGGEIIRPQVTFPSSSKIAKDVRASLPAEARLALKRATMPVIVPSATKKLRAIALVVEPEFYALSAKTDDNVSISVQGTKARVRYDDIPPIPGKTALHDGILGHVTQNEGIWTASWMENEVAYSVDFECASPEDAACADASRVIALAKELAYVGRGGDE